MEHQSFDPLQQVELTAKQVAKSTGEAVERLSHRESHVHSVRESKSLTPLQRAQQTAKEVAQSTGEAVEQLGSRLACSSDVLGRGGAELGTILPGSSMAGGRYGTPKRHMAPDYGKLQLEHRSSPLSPLQKAEFTAQRVAESTGESLHKLTSQSDRAGGKHSISPHEENGYSHYHEATTTRSSTTGSRLSSGPSPSNIHQGSVSANQLRASVGDQVSPFDKVKHTAEVVANSTGVAVQKLSSSLSENIV